MYSEQYTVQFGFQDLLIIFDTVTYHFYLKNKTF